MITDQQDRMLRTACVQSRSGIRDQQIHNDTHATIKIMPNGWVEVVVTERGSLDDWRGACSAQAVPDHSVVNSPQRRIRFKPRRRSL